MKDAQNGGEPSDQREAHVAALIATRLSPLILRGSNLRFSGRRSIGYPGIGC